MIAFVLSPLGKLLFAALTGAALLASAMPMASTKAAQPPPRPAYRLT